MTAVELRDGCSGVEALVGAKPGISLFLFRFRLFQFCCFSTLFPALEDAILVSETTGNRVSGFVYLIMRKSRQKRVELGAAVFSS